MSFDMVLSAREKPPKDTEGESGGACKGRRGGCGSWEERRDGDEAEERHRPEEKSFMPKKGLDDEDCFEGILDVYGDGAVLLHGRNLSAGRRAYVL